MTPPLEALDAVLPPGVAREYGPPPAPPLDYEENFVLPEHSVKPLQVLNRHPLDESLVFFEKPHVYTVDGVPTSISVTGLAHGYEKPFVPDEAIGLMRTSRSQAWPRLEYVVDARRLEPQPALDPARGALLVRDGKTVSVSQPHSLATGATQDNLRALLAASAVRGSGAGADDEIYTFERAMTDEEIAASWKRKGMLASHRGTEGHWLAELFANGLPCRWWEPEMEVLFGFVRTHLVPRQIVAFNTEKEIVCKDADLAGSIDLIVYEPATGLHHIIDHKRSDKLALQMRGYGKMLHPFQHLDDCKGASYALQTSIYQYVLEREYGMRIGQRILLSIHPDRPFCTAVPYLEAEVDFLFQQRFALVRARRAAQQADPDKHTCALTGAPLVDAVRLEDGRLAMEKAALVRELPFEADADARAAFDAAVDARLERVALRKEACLSWRKLMPEGGLPPFAP